MDKCEDINFDYENFLDYTVSEKMPVNAYDSFTNYSTNSKNDENKTSSNIHSSIVNDYSFSHSPKEPFAISKTLAETLILSNIGINEQIEKKHKPTAIEEITKKVFQLPKIKEWFYEALYKRLVEIVKKDNLDIKINKIDNNIKTLYDNVDIQQLILKDLFLYKYKNGKQFLYGNNVQLLQLINSNQATKKVTELLKKNYVFAFSSFIALIVQRLYESKYEIKFE